jgi:hypothetical protein
MKTKKTRNQIKEMRAERNPTMKSLLLQLVILSSPIILILALKPLGNLILDWYITIN